MSQDNIPPGVREALEYLSTGGLGEVVGFADIAHRNGWPKVQSDTDMAVALCILASRTINAEARADRAEAALAEAVEALTGLGFAASIYSEANDHGAMNTSIDAALEDALGTARVIIEAAAIRSMGKVKP